MCWVLVSVQGLSPVVSSGAHSSSRCTGLSLSRPLPLRSTGSRRAGSVAVAHGPSRSAARGIPPDRGTNPCPLHWQADFQPLRHQGSPPVILLKRVLSYHTFAQNLPIASHHTQNKVRASLVMQWLRICLLMQGTRVRALVWEDPTCRGATGPVSHNY